MPPKLMVSRAATATALQNGHQFHKLRSSLLSFHGAFWLHAPRSTVQTVSATTSCYYGNGMAVLPAVEPLQVRETRIPLPHAILEPSTLPTRHEDLIRPKVPPKPHLAIIRLLSKLLNVTSFLAASILNHRDSYRQTLNCATSALLPAVEDLAARCHITCKTLGRVLTLNPRFVSHPSLLCRNISAACRILGLDAQEFGEIITQAPAVTSYSPRELKHFLRDMADFLSLDRPRTIRILKAHPRILADGIDQLIAHTCRLHQSLRGCGSLTDAISLVAAQPQLLHGDMGAVAGSAQVLKDLCALHAPWQQQLQEDAVARRQLCSLLVLPSDDVLPLLRRLFVLQRVGAAQGVGVMEVVGMPEEAWSARWTQLAQC